MSGGIISDPELNPREPVFVSRRVSQIFLPPAAAAAARSSLPDTPLNPPLIGGNLSLPQAPLPEFSIIFPQTKSNKLILSNSQYTGSFTVRSYEVDSTGTATLPQVANYFQEAAGLHAHELNFDISHLHEKDLTWILFRMHVVADRFPARWEKVTVKTWPSSGDGIRAFRDYQLLSETGEQLAAGISQWMVLNIKTRRPVRMPKEVMDMGLNVEKHMLEISREPFPQFEEADHCAEIRVDAGSLDMNNHANNVSYIKWMTGYMPAEFIKSHKCTSVELQYHAECGLNDLLISESKKTAEGVYLHRILKKENGKLIADGISRWTVIP